MGKDSGSGTATYDHYGDIAGVIGRGPVDALVSLTIDDHMAWPKATGDTRAARKWKTGKSYTAGMLKEYNGRVWQCLANHTSADGNKPPNPSYWIEYYLAAGTADSTDVTISARRGFTIYWGTPTQNVDSRLTAAGNDYGEEHPAYRGLCYIVLKDFYLGRERNTATPNIKAVVRRRPRHSVYTPATIATASRARSGNVATIVTAAAHGLSHGDAIAIAGLGGTGYNLPFASVGVVNATTFIYPCTGANEGTTADAAGDITIYLRESQANLIDTAAELLTDSNGLGVSAAALSDSAFQAAAEYLDGRRDEVASSPLLTDQDTMRSLQEKLADIADSFLRYNAATDKIEAGTYVHGAAPGSYTTLAIADLTEVPEFSAEGWAQAKTPAVIQFKDRDRLFKDSSDQAPDLRTRRVIGENRPMTLNAPWITRRAQAHRYAAETLKVDGRPQATGEISVRREKGRDIRPGDYVRLDIDMEPGGTQLLQFFRVIERTIPKFGPIRMRLEAEENLSPVPVSPSTAEEVEAPPEIVEVSELRVIPMPGRMATQLDSVAVLAERPAKQIEGIDIHFDTDTGGTFQEMAATPAFAQRATLRSNFGATLPLPTTIEVTVPAQVDTDLFAVQPGALLANDDTLLAILVEMDGANIKEDADGYVYVELCSISAQSLVSAGNYDLTVLRARQGTQPRAFTTANCEVWLIYRKDLLELAHADFRTLRSNRAIGDTPDTGYFRLQPFTVEEELALADCTSHAFRFPRRIQAGPVVTLTAPTGATANVTSPYPATLNVTGTASDVDANLISYRVSVKKDGDTAETLVEEQVFSPSESHAFDVPVQFGEAGTFFIYVRAFDSTGLSTENVITVTAAAGAAKVATPELYYMSVRIPGGSTLSAGNGIGAMEARCSTPGATIRWRWFWNDGGGGSGVSAWFTYNAANPATWPVVPDADQLNGVGAGNLWESLQVQAQKGGMTDSDFTYLHNGAT